MSRGAALMQQRVLVVGGSGYLGQFVVEELLRRGEGEEPHLQVFATRHSTPLEAAGLKESFQVNLASGEGLDIAIAGADPHVVVNCAAISSPGVCEKEQQLATAINVPSHLLDALTRHLSELSPLLIHISTDQVYDGSRSLCTEEFPTEPLNHYGRTKVAAEKLIRERWADRHVILRSSIIYGPQAPYIPLQRNLPVQWMDSVLSGSEPFTFFHDEFRNPIFVQDILQIISALLVRGDVLGTFNMGGPQRLSRVDMATAVAKARGLSTKNILQVSASSVKRGVASPADISMDSSLLFGKLAISPITFEVGLAMIYRASVDKSQDSL